MTVRVQRTFDLPATPDRVWEFISDPANRANAISVVTDFTLGPDHTATWQLELPIPVLDRTVPVETRDVERRDAEYVKFTGRSKIAQVFGEHELQELDDGTRLKNTFVVDGRVPGVEKFFERNMDGELQNLEAALLEDLEGSA